MASHSEIQIFVKMSQWIYAQIHVENQTGIQTLAKQQNNLPYNHILIYVKCHWGLLLLFANFPLLILNSEEFIVNIEKLKWITRYYLSNVFVKFLNYCVHVIEYIFYLINYNLLQPIMYRCTVSGIPIPFDDEGNELCLLYLKYGRCRYRKKCKKSHRAWFPPLPGKYKPVRAWKF